MVEYRVHSLDPHRRGNVLITHRISKNAHGLRHKILERTRGDFKG